MARKKSTKIDPRIDWITLSEALTAWHIASSSTVIWAYWHGHVLMRKSGKIWTVHVRGMVKWFGEPKEPIAIPLDAPD